VPGKAALLFGVWAETLQASRSAPDPATLNRGLVPGKSLARAYWTDERASVAELSERDLAPLLAVVLDADRKAARWATVQLVAELASDLRFECSMRPTPACTDSADARSSFRDRLAGAVVRALAGSELEFYTAQLTR
jgi:hypothetical protein